MANAWSLTSYTALLGFMPTPGGDGGGGCCSRFLRLAPSTQNTQQKATSSVTLCKQQVLGELQSHLHVENRVVAFLPLQDRIAYAIIGAQILAPCCASLEAFLLLPPAKLWTCTALIL